MTYVLVPKCNFLYGFFQCQLPEDTINVGVTVRTMKRIRTFKRSYHPSNIMQTLEFPTLPFFIPDKKMKACLEGIRSNTNPLCPNHTYPNRLTILPPKKSQAPQKWKARDIKKRSRNHQTGRRQYKLRRTENPST